MGPYERRQPCHVRVQHRACSPISLSKSMENRSHGGTHRCGADPHGAASAGPVLGVGAPDLHAARSACRNHRCAPLGSRFGDPRAAADAAVERASGWSVRADRCADRRRRTYPLLFAGELAGAPRSAYRTHRQGAPERAGVTIPLSPCDARNGSRPRSCRRRVPSSRSAPAADPADQRWQRHHSGAVHAAHAGR